MGLTHADAATVRAILQERSATGELVLLLNLADAPALRVVEAEALVTRYRLRAVRDRWIPRLEQALAEVTFAIEEQELADAARLRLASGPGAGANRRSSWRP